MNKSNNDPSKRVYAVFWVKESGYPIKIIKRIEKFNSFIHTISFYIPENFIHGSGSYLLETSKFPQYIHEQIWELVKKYQKFEVEKKYQEFEVEKTRLLDKQMKVDLRKTTKNSLRELQEYCLETHSVLISRGQKMSQFEKGKSFSMLEIGTKLKKIMYKER